MHEALRIQLEQAGVRFRRERLSRAGNRIAWGLAGALLIVVLLGLLSPVRAIGLVLSGLALTGGLVAVLAIYLRRPERQRLLMKMDEHAKLPDAVLSTGDWENVAGDPWREGQRAVTLRKLEGIDWRAAWPVAWLRTIWLPLGLSLVMIGVITQLQLNWNREQEQARLAQREAQRPVSPDKLKPIEAVFQDWDKAQEITPSPELAEMLKELKPLRDEMASGKMTEKDLLLKLNDVQARLQEVRDKLDAASMEPAAQSIADAVKDLEGLSGLAAALQRKDFAAASAEAMKARQKYQTGEAKMPTGDKAQSTASKLGDAAKKSDGNQQASSGLKQMQDGTSKQDSSNFSKGLDNLQQSMNQEASRQNQSRNLSTQLQQLNDSRSAMNQQQGQDGNGNGAGQGTPPLSLAQALQRQKGAGTNSDPNRTGTATQIDAAHQRVTLTGTAGNGSGEAQTQSTTDPHREQTAGSNGASPSVDYQKLSEQATQDENLPVADRQTIKRYFEDIRPPAGQ